MFKEYARVIMWQRAKWVSSTHGNQTLWNVRRGLVWICLLLLLLNSELSAYCMQLVTVHHLMKNVRMTTMQLPAAYFTHKAFFAFHRIEFFIWQYLFKSTVSTREEIIPLNHPIWLEMCGALLYISMCYFLITLLCLGHFWASDVGKWVCSPQPITACMV